MPRVAEQDVLKIIDTELTKEEVAPFLTTANLLTTDVLAGAGYSDELLADIEKWLAAHFVAVRDPRIASETIGDVSATYDGKTGMGLASTRYGQQVMVLEYRGRFRALDASNRSVDITVLG